MSAFAVEAALLVLLVVAAVATALFRDILSAIIMFAGYSFVMSLLWLVFRAPDVALTEAAIGAGVTSILFLLTIARTVRPTREDLPLQRVSWPTVFVVGVFASALLVTVPELPAVGDPTAPAVSYDQVSQYYLEHAYEETGVKNVVTAVLASYRGFDTLGEAVVVFAAGIGMLVALRKEVFA